MAPIKHGKSTSPTYRIWLGIRCRCNNPNTAHFPDYGGRGISVCERWGDFANFLADMGERPPGLMIDRIDNDGNYEPTNCRWATKIEQGNNRRNNIKITSQGRTMTVAQWAAELGISRGRIIRRLRAEWPIDRVLSRDKFPNPSGIIAGAAALYAKRRALTACKHGHALTPENTLIHKNGSRHCKECGRNRAREHYRKKAGTSGRPPNTRLSR